MTRLRMHKWDEWQSYRSDRGVPPWIKVHRSLRDSPKWASLTDAQRGQLVCLWMLAADDNGWIPADPALLRKLCMLDEEPDLQTLISVGFIQRDVNVTSSWRQHDRPETETETETEYTHHARARVGQGVRSDNVSGLDDLTVSKIRGLYGWQGAEGTDPLLSKAFDAPELRDRCVKIAIGRLESEGQRYQARFFRKILEAVVDEQTRPADTWAAFHEGIEL